MNTQDLDRKDYQYIVEKPDHDFSPSRNKAVIEETIRDYEKLRSSQGQVIEQALGERLEAVAAYGCYRFNRGHKDVEGYLGKRIYRELLGERLIEKIRVMQSVNRLQGNTGKFRNFVLA